MFSETAVGVVRKTPVILRMPSFWASRQSGLGRRVEGVGRMGGGFLTIVVRCCCLLTRFPSTGLLLPRLGLQVENRFLINEIGLGLKGFEIGLVFLLAKEDEAALVIQPLLLHLTLYLIQLLTYLSSR